MMFRVLTGLAAALLLLTSGCKDPLAGGAGGTSGAALYVFDSTTSKVFAWSDLSVLYDSTTAAPAPTYQISSTLFSKVTNLAWGGLCVDRQRGLLYLVSETGDIVRVSRLRSQSGTVATVDVASFQLDSGQRLTNGKFGQASLDVQNDSLLITESGDNGTRIWVVASASVQFQGATVALQALQISTDKGGTGVAAAGGDVYAFMKDGDPVGTIVQYTGSRLRKGTAAGFDPAQAILGTATALGIYGTLALDTSNGYLYVARHNTDAASTAAPIQVFRTGQFPPGGGNNQASTYTLGSATSQPDLRVISHPGTKDWLVGLKGAGTVGYETIFLWKAPMGGVAAKAISAPAGSVLKGIAVDGNAS